MKPTGTDILRKLLDLYAKQENVHIKYRIEKES